MVLQYRGGGGAGAEGKPQVRKGLRGEKEKRLRRETKSRRRWKEERREGIAWCIHIFHSRIISFCGTFCPFSEDCPPPTFPTPNSSQMVAIGTAMVKPCDPTLWVEFIGLGVGLDPSRLIRMHPWEFGIRIELFRLSGCPMEWRFGLRHH